MKCCRLICEVQYIRILMQMYLIEIFSFRQNKSHGNPKVGFSESKKIKTNENNQNKLENPKTYEIDFG